MKDVACAIAGLVLAAGYWLLADELPRSLLSDPTGADGLPKVLAVALALASAVILVMALRRRAHRAEAAPGDLMKHVRAAGMLGLGVAYLVALPWLGYPIAVFLFMLAVALYAGTRPGITPVAIGAAGAAILWFTFEKLFGIGMPDGILF